MDTSDGNRSHFQANELAVLIEILTQNNMVTIGIRSTVQELIDFARFSGLVVFAYLCQLLANW
jgi:septum site-determining protein MinC